jgi:hypothetical protein
MVKKLRYLARFIVVCLLLKRTKQVKELIKEFSKEIEDYVKIYDSEDQLEWQLVRNEINDFIESDNLLGVNGEYVSFANRLSASKTPTGVNLVAGTNPSTNLFLHEVVIVGNCSNQVGIHEYFCCFELKTIDGAS